MASETGFVEVSKKSRKIDKHYLSALDSLIAHIKAEKKKWVAQVRKEPKLIDAYDCLRLSADILENYKRMAETATPNDNPKVIDYALPTLGVVEDCLKLVMDIDKKMEQKKIDPEEYEKQSKSYSMQLQEVGKIYLTDFDAAIQRIPRDVAEQAVSVLNKEIVDEFCSE